MKIRLSGTADECEQVLAILREHLAVLDVSRPYPNRPPSPLQRVYVDAQIPRTDDGRTSR